MLNKVYNRLFKASNHKAISDISPLFFVGQCIGMTLPSKANFLGCHWRKSCYILWPTERIFSQYFVGGCIGKRPTFMAVSFECFKPTDFLVGYGYFKTPGSGLISTNSYN
jgi:hypothetical protein